MNRWLLLLCLLTVLLATVAVYSRSLQGEPIFDDGYVFGDPERRVTSLTSGELYRAATATQAEPRRSLTNLTFTLNFHFFGDGTASFHAVNLLLHLLTTLACFGFLREILRLAGREEGDAARIALIAAALFAVNPIQTQAVSYIWQRAAVLAALLAFSSLWLFAAGLRAGRWKIAVAVLLVPLAVLAKQNAVMIIPAMFGIVLLFRRPKTPAGVAGLLVGGVGVLVLAFYAASAFWWGGESAADVISRGYAGREFTLGQRLLTQPRVVLSLLSLTLLPLPARMNLDHDVMVSTDLFAPWTTFPAHLLLILAGVTAIVIGARRPLPAFGILWFLLMLLPESTVVPLELMFEHRAYLPSAGVFLLVALALNALYRRRPSVASTLTVTLLVVLAALTWMRNEVWTSRILMWEDVTAKSPGKARGHHRLGLAWCDRFESGDESAFLKARIALGRGLQLDGRDDCATALAHLHRLRGVEKDIPAFLEDVERMRLSGQTATADAALRSAIGSRPQDVRLHYELARVLASAGGISEAFDALERSIELGFRDRERLEWDPALSTLRPKRRFNDLMEKIE